MFEIKVFKERLRALRERAGINQEEFAKKIGIARASASYYENTKNTSLPNAEVLCKAADYLGVSSDYLLGLSEHETVSNALIAEQIPLSDKALDFLRDCPPELRGVMDSFLSNQMAHEFFMYFSEYANALNNDNENEAPEIETYRRANRGTSLTMPNTKEIIKELQWRKVESSLKDVATDIANERQRMGAVHNGND